MNYNVTVNGKVYNVSVEKTGAAAPAPAVATGRPQTRQVKASVQGWVL